MKQSLTQILRCLSILSVLGMGSALDGADLKITEFMAANGGGHLDEDGDTSDWVEIQNTTIQFVNLSNWALTDDPGDLSKWVFPSKLLGPGEFLIIFCSGKDRAPSDGELHTNFKLDSKGEYLALVRRIDGEIATEFSPQYPLQHTDVSFGEGQQITAALVEEGDLSRVHVPSSDILGTAWTGGAPFDDSLVRGWIPAPLAVGYPKEVANHVPPPQSYWSFDGDFQDRGMGGDHADSRGARFDNRVPPQIGTGQSLDFDGQNDYVSIEIDVSEVEYTVSFWFQADASGRGLYCVVDSDLGGGGHDRHLYLNGGNIATRLWSNEVLTSSGRNYADGQWHHICHVYGGEIGGQEIYIDGERVLNGVKDYSDFDWQQRINLGFSNDAQGTYFDGRIDELAVWNIALSVDEIVSLSEGVNPATLSGIGAFVETDIEDELKGEGSSLFMRIPFEVELPFESQQLQLQMRYEDGFLAYLNGTPVISSNAPLNPGFDSLALTDRSVSQATRVVALDLSGHIDLLVEGTNILAIHGLNESVDGEEFLIAPRLVASDHTVSYIKEPSPGAPNIGQIYEGFVGELSLSHRRGLYESSFELEIETPEPTAEIRYTLDGSVPTETTGDIYTGPILIDGMTVIRIQAFKENWIPSPIETHSYLFITDVKDQPAMIDTIVNHPTYGPLIEPALRAHPSVSINIPNSVTTVEREASIELIFPDGKEGFQIDAGIKRVGGHSLGAFPKNSMRLYFRSKYGKSKLKYDVFDGTLYGESAIKSYDRLHLRSGSHDSIFYLGANVQPPSNGQYLRNRFMHDMQFEMGQFSLHGRWVQVYINGAYWGHYQLMERPSADLMAEYMGGEKDEFEAINSGQPPRVIGDRWDGWAHIQTIRDDYDEILRWVDVESLADYMLLNFWAGNDWDWSVHHNWMAGGPSHPDRGGYKFISWDADIIWRRLEDYNLDHPGPNFIFSDLLQHDDFKLLVADRIHKHFYNDGLLTPGRVRELYDRRVEEIQTSIVAETARWQWSGTWTRDQQWAAELARLRTDFFPRRTQITIDQIRGRGLYPTVEPPLFRVDGVVQYGGIVDKDQFLSMEVPDEAGGSFVDTEVIDESSPVSVLVPQDDSVGDSWKQLNFVEGAQGETWIQGLNGVGYETTSGYEGVINVDVIDLMRGNDGNNSVYVRIPFTIQNAAELQEIDRLLLSINADDGFAAYINGQRVTSENAPDEDAITWNSNATAGGETQLANPSRLDITEHKGLLQVGENLLAIHGLNFATSSSDMLVLPKLLTGRFDPSGGNGNIRYTLDGSDPRDPEAQTFDQAITLDKTLRVKARSLEGDNWSALSEAVFVVSGSLPLRITEIHYHPRAEDDPDSPFGDNDFEFLEIKNTGSETVSLFGVKVTGDIEFDFSESEVQELAPDAYVVIVEDLGAFSQRYQTQGMLIAGEYSGDLNNSGGTLTVLGPLDETVQSFTFDDIWYPTTDGVGDSLTVVDEFINPNSWTDAQLWKASSVADGTPGQSDSGGNNSGWRLPGDANADRNLDLGDAISLLLMIYRGGVAMPCDGDSLEDEGNLTLLDLNQDLTVDASDAIYLLTFLYVDGPAPGLGTDCERILECSTLCDF